MKIYNKKTRILITGGAGFIGSHLTDCFLENGYEVIVLDNLVNGKIENLEYAKTYQNFTFLKGDIRNTEDVKNALKEIDYVFHLACLGVRHSIHSPFENHEVNAEGTLQLLIQARENNIKHFFYISTSEIYGRTNLFPITESAPTYPLTVYGASKLAGENYTLAFLECYNFPSTVFRIFNNYGPRAHYEGDSGEILPRSIVKALYNEQPVIFGDGSITRDFYFVKDTAESLLAFLKTASSNNQKHITGETYNIGTGNEISIKDLIEKLLITMKKEFLGIQYLPDRPADVPRLWVNTNKFKTQTGYEPKFLLEDGLGITIRFYEDLMKRKNLINEIQLNNWLKESK